ncbi:MAG: TolC family outer membrane protein [Pseudomonadota bacterium]
MSQGSNRDVLVRWRANPLQWLAIPHAKVPAAKLVLFSRHAMSSALLILTAALTAPTVQAETLFEALQSAYQKNPQLDSERARLRATDEEVPRAKSGYRPTIQGNVTYGTTRLKSSPNTLSDGRADPAGWSVTLNQPVFTGFRTTNAISEAEALVRAGREDLRRVEATVLLDAVTAYMDVVRDKEILKLQEANVNVLSRELEAAKARRAVQEVTLTDVAQARARRARAVSAVDLAKANLRVSRAAYRRVIGHESTRVSEPELMVEGVPDTLEEALTIAKNESSNVISALYREQASKFAVNRTWSELLPRVDLEASYERQDGPTALIDNQETASLTGRLTIPFYQGGEVRARVRQAKHTHVSRLQQVEQARNETEENVTSAWSQLVAARAQIRSDNIAVRSAGIALEGVREEERVGQRTLLDVLDAEQEFLDAEVARTTTRRNIVVASYTLLSAMGRLEAELLSVTDAVYEPVAHYNDVRNEWFRTSITRRPSPPLPFAHPMDADLRSASEAHYVDVAPGEPLAPDSQALSLKDADYEDATAHQDQPLRGTVSVSPSRPRFKPTRDFHPEALLADVLRATLR